MKYLIIILLIITNYPSSPEIYVTKTDLNLRKGPGIHYAIITTIPKGEKLEIIESDDDWKKIMYLNQVGYVSAKYIQLDSSAEFQTFLEYKFVIMIAVLLLAILIIIIVNKRPKTIQTFPSDNSNKSLSSEKTEQKTLIVTPTKNIGLAVFLSILFPYFGVLYSSISGFFWLFFSYLGMWAFFLWWMYQAQHEGPLFIGMILSFIHWGISIICAGIWANSHNKNLIKNN